MLTVALIIFAWLEPLHAFSSTEITSSSPAAGTGIRIRRLEADTNFLFPTNAKRLTEFLMDVTYGECRPFSSAWAQRAVIDATARSELYSRLAYYQKELILDENGAVSSGSGAIFIAEDEENNCELVGFVDIGASLWDSKQRMFQLPMNDDNLKRRASIELVPYVSNLVVDTRVRRRGIGKRLMEACDAEVTGWRTKCATNSISLEVTLTNQVALDFYRAMGYVIAKGSSSTPGTEMKREGDSFRMEDVQRCLMQKELMQSSSP